MMDELKKMMMAKKGKMPKMDEGAIEAKLDVIKELLGMAQAAMAGKVREDMDGMQKVSVMAPDEEGLKEGLEVAEDVVEGEVPEMEEETEEPQVEGMASLMQANDEPEEEENLFARKRSKQLQSY